MYSFLIGVALGAFMLRLIAMTLIMNAKKARMKETERRAYEEEALQVSMVDNVRALTTSGTRIVPTIEHEYHYWILVAAF
ncbi:hypothetical protein C2S52_018707 [Perilla frutescens var. hirtella]|nr:hypothetical protein C2S52_018707 [Perilla frutescens var. hirtella]KAH6812385.1 hypothetical protein C2S51_026147 [Perilla frutescens var. frutescens]